MRQVHSGREYVSVRDCYSKIVGGPTPTQIAKSLGLSGGPLDICEFIAEPKSRKGNTQVICGMVVSIKLIDRNGPAWIVFINEVTMPATSNIVIERKLKIYYHSSGEGIILSE